MSPRSPRLPRGGRKPGVSNVEIAARHAAMGEMHRQGASVAEIARHFGCSWKGVDYALSKARTGAA